MPGRNLVNATLALVLCTGVKAADFHERELLIPWAEAAPRGLDALLVYADLPGKHPLAVLTHGTAREREPRTEVSPWALLPQAMWFARRGWVALVVVRRGYGRSGGKPDFALDHCPHTDYIGAADHSAEDLARAIEFAAALPEVDASRTIAIGVSTGGLATVALTAHAPKSLVAAISFAGGRGSHGDRNVCAPSNLVDAFGHFGKRSRVPMLWIYAQNDLYFWPELAAQFDQAFRARGGREQLVMAPALGQDGHSLFRSVPNWSATVDQFLEEQGLAMLPAPLPPPALPDVPFPSGLSEIGSRAFRAYLASGPFKAFAQSEHGFGMAVAQLSPDRARDKAVENCRKATAGGQCRVVYQDNSPAAK